MDSLAGSLQDAARTPHPCMLFVGCRQTSVSVGRNAPDTCLGGPQKPASHNATACLHLSASQVITIGRPRGRIVYRASRHHAPSQSGATQSHSGRISIVGILAGTAVGAMADIPVAMHGVRALRNMTIPAGGCRPHLTTSGLLRSSGGGIIILPCLSFLTREGGCKACWYLPRVRLGGAANKALFVASYTRQVSITDEAASARTLLRTWQPSPCASECSYVKSAGQPIATRVGLVYWRTMPRLSQQPQFLLRTHIIGVGCLKVGK